MEIFDYDNILLLPRKCLVESRSECDAGVELGGRKFRIPVVPANMKTVIDEKICVWLAENGYFYVMHRFDLDNVQFVRDMRARGVYASISLGVKAPDYAAVDQMVDEGLIPEYITIDIAHGHAESVRKMIEHIKQKLPKAFVICRRSSGAPVWRPNPSSPTVAFAAMATSPRASASALRW